MKGTAPPDSLTGKVQRALTDEWQTQAQISARMGVAWRQHESPKPSTIRALLERLCSEGRAEWQVHRHTQLSGGVVRWRKPTGEARASQRAAEHPPALAGDDGNAGTPVAPTPKGER